MLKLQWLQDSLQIITHGFTNTLKQRYNTSLDSKQVEILGNLRSHREHTREEKREEEQWSNLNPRMSEKRNM